MPDPAPDPVATGKLIFETLRLANALAAAGDALMQPLGLTSARWQVLGTLAFLGEGETVSGLARRLGLSRQSVQRLVDEMVAAGILELRDNPAHKRARLAVVSAKGRELHRLAEARRQPWTEGLASALAGHDPAAAEAALRALRETLTRTG